MTMANSVKATQASLEQEIRDLSAALDQLKQRAVQDTQRNYGHFRANASRAWEGSQEQLSDAYEEISQRALQLSREAKDCAKAHPLGSIALGVGACALIGWLLCRR
jgi:ElaB/YqjD/DUF883 family membrane-anchored ribosome-binding protein